MTWVGVINKFHVQTCVSLVTAVVYLAVPGGIWQIACLVGLDHMDPSVLFGSWNQSGPTHTLMQSLEGMIRYKTGEMFKNSREEPVSWGTRKSVHVLLILHISRKITQKFEKYI